VSWQPTDDELDAAARSLPAPDAERARAEETRTALLASAATRAQLSRRSRVPLYALGGALAAAAAIVVWIGVRPAPSPAPTHTVAVAGKRQAIMAMGKATFTRGDWPDYIVTLDDGRISVEVAQVQDGERFRVITSDAEVEVRGTKFEVEAAHGKIAEVAVREGRVEVRADSRVIILAAGETWSATRTVQRDVVIPTAPASPTSTAPAPAPSTTPTPTAPIVRNTRTARIEKTPTPTPTPDHAKLAATPDQAKPAATPDQAKIEPPKPVEAPKPGEDEFRAGWTALRGGDAAAATKLFASACARAANDALGEDACFWAGAAAKRANDTKTARTAFAHFLDRFPSSARAPEASALLGWILYDAGDLDGAEAKFKQAVNDKVPKVRDSATKGLEAIRRKRAD
jgi:TolA-binding protein